jgi:hypothetical protein
MLSESLDTIFTGIVATAALIQIGIERSIRLQAEKRQQASHISAWLADAMSVPALASLNNASPEPVFEVIVSLVAIHGAAPHDGREYKNLSYIHPQITQVACSKWEEKIIIRRCDHTHAQVSPYNLLDFEV